MEGRGRPRVRNAETLVQGSDTASRQLAGIGKVKRSNNPYGLNRLWCTNDSLKQILAEI
jgi:hypothetical protein